MKRLESVWLVFGLCVALAAAAMARLGGTALGLERAEARARRQATLEENLQLALWRMDSALAPLLAEESARPYFTYSPLYPAERAFTKMFAEIERGDVLMPSPLLTSESAQVRLHFQYGPDGRLSSPQVPAGNMRDLAENRYLAPERIEAASRRLDELATLINREELAAALLAPDSNSMSQMAAMANQADIQGNQSRSSQEFMMRSRNSQIAQRASPAAAQPLSTRVAVSQGPLQAVWIGPTLILARRVRVPEGTFLQGCWLDWDFIRRELIEGARDLLPSARLEGVPAQTAAAATPTRMLASLPVRLDPGSALDGPEPFWSPVRLSLFIAWTCLGLAALAVALVLYSALALSERRGTFVSAVTHELRTPLTTFRLYTEMLDEGMVASQESRKSYLKTIRAEADRLGHLVENVLSFARLERGRATGCQQVVAPAELLERLVPHLALRAREAGMELVVAPVDSHPSVRADISVVEQILTNLVDNAIKYAGGAADARIHLNVVPSGRWLALSVADHGPGLDPKVIRRLFRPFSKSASDAAQSAPGVGLGLALSRRLARASGGDLRLTENSRAGATFTLTIPLA
jgi:signal transduction histidine kinase